jgi:hypothetical protein
VLRRRGAPMGCLPWRLIVALQLCSYLIARGIIRWRASNQERGSAAVHGEWRFGISVWRLCHVCETGVTAHLSEGALQGVV